ncbi:hypothetical protein NK983_27465, partial [Salmonella enterica subsp. enterica serovar Typhimurium]|nr:hypothetical protein [Salmonella enterica subsp. enterica serovar Typhimurium]
VENATITGMYQMAPNGWPLPAGPVDLLTNPENTVLPLKTGVLLVIPTQTISTGSTTPSLSLQAIADANHTTGAALGMQNDKSPVLQPGFEFTV